MSRPVRIAADDQGDESTAASSTRPPLPALMHAPAPNTKTDSGELLPALPCPATSLRPHQLRHQTAPLDLVVARDTSRRR